MLDVLGFLGMSNTFPLDHRRFYARQLVNVQHSLCREFRKPYGHAIMLHTIPMPHAPEYRFRVAWTSSLTQSHIATLSACVYSRAQQIDTWIEQTFGA